MSLNRNTAANLVGRLWTAALGVVLIPLYIHLLGMESYALVGFYGTLQAVLLVTDFGLGAAFSRTVARLSAEEGKAQEQRDLLATLNVVYWSLALVIGLIVWKVAPLVATQWLRAEKVDIGAITTSVRLMGWATAVQLPIGLYQGGLIGLQRQVEYNVVSIVVATVRSVGVILVLIFISPRVEAFFLWQAIAAFASAAAHWIVLDRVLPVGERRAAFRSSMIAPILGYAAGWAANSVGTAIAQQMDKVIISRTVPLEQFGYYTLAANAAALLWTLVVPVSAAAFPRFNQSVAMHDEEALADEYGRANQLLAVILVPAATVLMFFSVEVMTVWTRKPPVAAQVEWLVVYFAVGMTLVGLVNLTLQVALSYGWFRLALGFTWGTAMVSAPLFWFASRRWGVSGAAAVWMLQNASYLLLVPILHRRYLRGAGVLWLKHAFALPLGASVLVCGVARVLMPRVPTLVGLAAALAGIWTVAVAGVVLVEPGLRARVFVMLSQLQPARRGR